MKILVLSTLGLALMGLSTGPASAGTLYDNNSFALGLDFSALTISGGCCGNPMPGDPSGAYDFKIADSFTLASGSTVTGVNFWVAEPGPTLTAPADQMLSVDWSIVANDGTGADAPFTGTVIASGTGTPVTDTLVHAYNFYDVDEISFSAGSVVLGGGTTYWLILGGPTDTLGYGANGTIGDGIYWEISDGPSAAFQLETVSDINYPNPYPCPPGFSSCTDSESFQILGNSSTPEPGSLTLLGGGLLLMAGLIRRRTIR